MSLLNQRLGKTLTLCIKPGRALVASAGSLYTSVTSVKKIGHKTQVVVDVDFGEFARPPL